MARELVTAYDAGGAMAAGDGLKLGRRPSLEGLVRLASKDTSIPMSVTGH